MKVLDLFSGIGGFSLGFERAGMKTVAFCEIEEYPRKVLKKHWPNVPCYPDIRELTAEQLENDGITVDLICGGYPCQPFSHAGKRQGKEDDRHLWPEYLRLIRELRPRWVIGENVAGHISMGLDDVLSDLEGEGYSWEAFVIPATSVGLPQGRERVWFMAHPMQGKRQMARIASGGWWKPEQISWHEMGEMQATPDFLGNVDGLPSRMDRNRALGNAVVPQIPEIIGLAIMELENETHHFPE